MCDKILKLNVGCGLDYRESTDTVQWINVDINETTKADIHHDLHIALPIEDLSVDHVYAGHVIEHCGFHVVTYCIGDWIRTLKIGGTISIRTPDLEALAKEYVDGTINHLAFVQQAYGGGYRSVRGSVHCLTIDWKWILSNFFAFGCGNIERHEGGRWELCVTAVKEKHVVMPIPPRDLYETIK